jgi:hypothetical protein
MGAVKPAVSDGCSVVAEVVDAKVVESRRPGPQDRDPLMPRHVDPGAPG